MGRPRSAARISTARSASRPTFAAGTSGSFIADVQQAVAARSQLPDGYYVEYGGQFENLQRASRRLVVVVPLALFLIFVLLYTTFNAVKPAVLIYFNIPVAATGGIVALFLRGMPFSISAASGSSRCSASPCSTAS